MTEGVRSPELAVVVSTIGRVEEFTRLIESVENSPVAEIVEFVVVDQSESGGCAQVLRSRDWTMTATATISARGASIGRNAGVELVSAPLVVFPDDDAWYPPETLPAIIAAFAAEPDLAGLCGRQNTSDGRPSMLRWQRHAGPVTARNFLQTSIMSTMFFRRSWLERIDPFDERMGVGAPSWYGACEESDLLLRLIEAGGRVDYRPDLVVWQEEPRDEPDERFVEKMLRYGCGQGHLWRKRRLSYPQLGYFLLRKLAAAAVRAARGRRVLARADLAWLWGNLAGVVDVEPRALRPGGRFHRPPVPTGAERA